MADGSVGPHILLYCACLHLALLLASSPIIPLYGIKNIAHTLTQTDKYTLTHMPQSKSGRDKIELLNIFNTIDKGRAVMEKEDEMCDL